jgi:AcrR family transcriptional regulator
LPKVSAEFLDGQRARILNAAIGTFAQLGFQQATIQDVCQTAGISHGALYRYFPSKESLVIATAEKLRQDFLSGLEQAAENDISFDQLVQGRPGSYDWTEAPGASYYLALSVQWWAEATTNETMREVLVDGFFDVWRKALAAIIERAQGRGEIRPDIDAHALGRVLLSIYYGLVLQKALDPDVDVSAYEHASQALMSGALKSMPDGPGSKQ